jgi:hypothetical protein
MVADNDDAQHGVGAVEYRGPTPAGDWRSAVRVVPPHEGAGVAECHRAYLLVVQHGHAALAVAHAPQALAVQRLGASPVTNARRGSPQAACCRS